jgi:hypothetical protein
MTLIYKERTLDGFKDRGGHVYSDLEFRDCAFVSCHLSVTEVPENRTIVRRVKAVNCEVTACWLWTGVFEDILVDGLKTHNMLASWGAVFKHVTLKGPIGQVMLNYAVGLGRATAEVQRAFDEANALYYGSVDWALDIGQGEFREADIRGIPSRLIRRHAETQAVVTRQKALEGRWRQLDLSKTWWATSIEHFAKYSNDPDVVLVAPKRHPRFRHLLDGIRRLRAEGIAEPD